MKALLLVFALFALVLVFVGVFLGPWWVVPVNGFVAALLIFTAAKTA